MDNMDRDFLEYFFAPEYVKAFSKDFAYEDKKDKDKAEVTIELFNRFFNTLKDK